MDCELRNSGLSVVWSCVFLASGALARGATSGVGRPLPADPLGTGDAALQPTARGDDLQRARGCINRRTHGDN